MISLTASKIRRKLESIKKNAHKLDDDIGELLKDIKKEQRHLLRAKISDECAILRLEKEEYRAALIIQNKATEASTTFREIYVEAPQELKHKDSALHKIYELIQQINQEVNKINNTPDFNEMHTSAVRIADWAEQALENIDGVYDFVYEHLPVYSKWATKHFST